MSRVGNAPVPLPGGVEVTIETGRFSAKGPKGVHEARIPEMIGVEHDGDVIRVTRPSDAREHKAFHGLARSLIANVVVGVSEGFEKALEIQGVGYRAAKEGSNVSLQVGYSHPVVVEPPAGIEFDVPSATEIVVKGVSKELVGQVAANIRKVRPPEPYKGKGIRYKGEQVKRKVGKAAK